MTLSTTSSRNDYTGNDTTATYSYSYRILLSSDLEVTVKKTSTGVETTLALTTDYTVTGVGAASGTIVLVDNNQAWLSSGNGYLDTGYTITIKRVTALTQSTDIRNQGDFYPEVHEDAFDKLTMIDQQQQDAIGRSIKMPVTVNPATFDAILPSPEADKFIKIDAAGTGFEYGSSTTSGLDNTAIIADAQIARSKLADGTASHVVINDASGVMSSEALLDKSRGGTGVDGTGLTFATLTGTQALTNKDIDGGTASNSNRITIPKADTSTLSALTRKQATLVYDTSLNKVYGDNGSALFEVGAEGALSSKTANYTATNADGYLLCNATSASFTITLYTAVGASGQVITIKKTDSSVNTVTIDANASETIDGSLTKVLRFLGDSLKLISDGANWSIIGSTRIIAPESLICSDCVGRGSANTAVPYFGTLTLNTLSKFGTMTYNDSTNGAIFTATAPCLISFNHRNASDSIANIGILKNGTVSDLDADIQSATEANIVAMDRQSDANTQAQCSFVGVLAIGDVIAPSFGPSETPYTVAQTQGLVVTVSALPDFS